MFVPVIHEVPDVFDVVESALGFAVITPLAVSDDGYRCVGVETRLLPFEEVGEAWHELKFSIVVLDEESGEPFRIFDRHLAQGYLPAEIRSLVMPCVIGALQTLVREIQPRSIYRVTHTSRPNEKALHKHELITDTLVELGFETRTGTDQYGRRFWEMRKEGGGHG